MKKALSVLLVAAALFGFYGSAVTVNDLLACKDYWEEAGEKSTADMNKLEDGLNQLKDNEQAYLDGLDQVADGEKQLAQGEADYAAAPAKLAAGRAALAEGEDALDSLNTLLGGIKQVHDGYITMRGTEKNPGYVDLRDGRLDTLKGLPKMASLLGSIQQLLTMTYGATSEPIQELGTASSILGAQAQNPTKTDADYADFNKALTSLRSALEATQPVLAATKAKANEAAASFTTSNEQFDSLASFISPYGYDTTTLDVSKALQADKIPETYVHPVAGTIHPAAQAAGGIKAGLTAKDEDDENAQSALDSIGALIGGFNETKLSEYQGYVATITGWENGDSTIEFGKAVVGVYNLINDTINKISGLETTLQNKIDETTLWTNGYAKLTSDDTINSKKNAVGGVAQIVDGIYDSGNKTLINGFKKGARAAGIDLANFRYTSSSKLAKDMKSESSIDDFFNDLEKVDKALQKGKATANKLKKNGEQQLAAGKRQLAQGEADYAAAPDQLAAGRKALEDGKAQLAQYEDGEQQIRDGLATLFNTEADLDLVSIADRLEGDGDFDNGDNHLEIEEGLNAVEVGRGYQAEDGVLITKEIMGRAVATGGLLAAAVLAVLAAILSFLNKNKAAGVFAILAAAAGAFGAFYGPAQGTYFSEIAGSTIGTTTWVAAGVLGAVALVHAIAHFAAKKAA